MKKTMFILLSIILLISVSACSSNVPGNEGLNPSHSPAENKPTSTKEAGKIDKQEPDTAVNFNDGKKRTLVFSTYFPDEFFKQAKKKYEAKHPNITIDLRYIESDDAHGEDTYEKFIKTTNTAMLSGSGPDLIEMDLLPVDNYVKKHLLTNMSEMIASDPTFKKENYFTNILDNIQLNGGIYGMPLNFFMYGLIGNETLIQKSRLKFDDKSWDWANYIDVVKGLIQYGAQDNKKYGLFASPDSMLNAMVNEESSTYVDQVNGKANFDSDTFIQLLKQVKSLSDEHIISQDRVQSVFSEVSIVSPTDYIRELHNSEFMLKGYEYKSKLYAKPHAEGLQAGGYFRPYKTIGINAKSSVKDVAWDFVKFMLSDEMQASLGSAGFPLNKNIYHQQLQQLVQAGQVKSDQEMGPLKGKVFKVTAADVQGLEQFLLGAIHPVAFKPSKVDGIIVEESKAYFSGQKSAEAVAKLIQNRVMTVLNE